MAYLMDPSTAESLPPEIGESTSGGLQSFVPKVDSRWVTGLSLYAVTLGVMFQLGYWGSLDVDVMAYLGFEDVLRVSIVPVLMVGTMALIAGIALGYVRSRSPVRSSRWKQIISIVTVVVLIPLLVFIYISWHVLSHTYVVLVTIAVVLMVSIEASGIAGQFRPKLIRTVMITMLTLGPLVALAFGIEFAHDVKSGRGYYLAVIPDGVRGGLTTADAGLPVYYLGHIKDYDFFRVQKRTLVVKSSALPSFSYTWEEDKSKWPRFRLGPIDISL